MTYLQTQLKIPKVATLVCGDSGNDISLFTQKTLGVIVNNAQPELLQWYQQYRAPGHYYASAPYAAGIYEALDYFRLG
jgi:hydroxymethylpyrimidine pyrophosphatase-like HAD family hydrolase